ncbi:MAG: alpha/beta hydrolase, partial [Psychrobacter sp.]|nr:alpha/beta hydrolase [Psychrobacter sp.]
WKNGNKDQYAFVGESLAQAGYVTAVINYRKAPEFVYPAYVEDTAQAIAWTHQNASKFYADSDKLAVAGQSAGAFNAVAAVSNADFLAPFGIKPSDIKAVVGIAGPYSYDFRTSDSRDVFPKNGNPDNIMPDRLVKSGADGKQPDYLLLTAENDKIVGDENTQRMTAALRQAKAEVMTSEIKKASHATSIAAMATPLRGLNDVRQQVLNYLQQKLQ